MTDPTDTRTEPEIAIAIAAERQHGLQAWGIEDARSRGLQCHHEHRIMTPGSTAGEPLHVLSSLERRSPRWDDDPEAARASLSAAVSLVLRLLGRDCDPARSKEHVLLSVLAERRLRAGEPADIGALLGDLTKPPVDSVGASRSTASSRR